MQVAKFIALLAHPLRIHLPHLECAQGNVTEKLFNLKNEPHLRKMISAMG